MQLFMDGLVLYIHVCLWDTLITNPIVWLAKRILFVISFFL